MRLKNILFIEGIILLSLVYYIAGSFGLNFEPVSGFATLIWLPTGISLVSLFKFGMILWPGVSIGAFFVNWSHGAPAAVAALMAIGNTLEAVIAAYFLKKVNFDRLLERQKDVLSLITVAALMSTTVSATFGTTSMWAGGLISVSETGLTWGTWWLGDMLSNLIIAPVLLVIPFKIKSNVTLKRVIEFLALVSAVLLISLFVFTNRFDVPIRKSPTTYLVFPPLIWAALRFNQQTVIGILVTLSAFAIWGTLQGTGPFIGQSLHEQLLYIQSFLGITSITSLILGSVVAERRTLAKQKDEFIGIAGHELKTPIASLKLNAQLLHQRLLHKHENDLSKLALKINQQIDKVTNLITDLLDTTKIETGKLTFQQDLFDFDQLVREVVEEMQLTTQNHTILQNLSVNKKVRGDRERIAQVLTNLLSNAIKYSPEADRIIIKSFLDDRNITLSVQDFGIGIPSEKQDKIFERFYQAGTTEHDSTAGLGLGLYISGEILKLHHGQIWFESEPGKGSTFYFTLPQE